MVALLRRLDDRRSYPTEIAFTCGIVADAPLHGYKVGKETTMDLYTDAIRDLPAVAGFF